MHNITKQTFFLANKYGDMASSDARERKDLETENAWLKKTATKQILAIEEGCHKKNGKLELGAKSLRF